MYIKSNFEVAKTIKDLYTKLRQMPKHIDDEKMVILTSEKKNATLQSVSQVSESG